MPVVRGTSARTSGEHWARRTLAECMLDFLDHAGYDRIETPGLDLVELHERKSGAAITTRLVELADISDQGLVCLRPELTVGVVRSLIESGRIGEGPARVSVRGSVYRRNQDDHGRLQEIEQVGAELVGDASVEADAEAIALAFDALAAAGIGPVTIRLGDVGLILEAVTASGLPPESRKAIVEALADAAADGRGISQVEDALEHWADWLGDQPHGMAGVSETELASEFELYRLFHHLVGPVVGRRTESEILGRLRQKWRLAESLPGALRKAARLVHELGSLSGPPAQVLATLASHPIGTLASNARERLGRLVELLTQRHGIAPDRIRIELGVARGIGFYSGLVFSLHSDAADGLELGGGGRYDGLASVLGMTEGDDFGVGFAIGLDRLRQVLPARSDRSGRETFVLFASNETEAAALGADKLVDRVRAAGGRARLATPADTTRGGTRNEVRIDIDTDGQPTASDPAALERFLAFLNRKS